MGVIGPLVGIKLRVHLGDSNKMVDIVKEAAQEIVSNVMSMDDRLDIMHNREKWIDGMQNQIDYATGPGWDGLENYDGQDLVEAVVNRLSIVKEGDTCPFCNKGTVLAVDCETEVRERPDALAYCNECDYEWANY